MSRRAVGGDEILDVDLAFSGWLRLLMVTARLSGEVVVRPVVEHPSGSAVLAYDPRRRVACTLRQTRLPVLHAKSEPLEEPVAGVTEAESPEETARRECEEEVGIRLDRLEPVGVVWMTPSSSTERVHLFLGEYSLDSRVGKGGGEEGELEDLVCSEVPLGELWMSIEQGKMSDAKLYMLLQALRVRRPNLFEA